MSRVARIGASYIEITKKLGKCRELDGFVGRVGSEGWLGESGLPGADNVRESFGISGIIWQVKI